jgi:threonine dehydrogenase-like Zn-dependent dehydrogenase
MGADIAYSPAETDLDSIMSENGIFNIDKIIECVGFSATQQYAIDHIGKATEVMLFGLGGPNDKVTLKPYDMFRNQARILSSFINPSTFQQTVDLVESGKFLLSEIVADTVSLEDLADVLGDPERRKEGKVLVRTGS